jgi:pantetheine-phosphate adenylyltransferase
VTIALYPGSFDPIHNGHVDVVEEAAALFGEVILCAMVNPAKVDPLFDLDTRRQMLVDAVAHVPGVRIELFHGLAVDAVKQFGADLLVKGLRTATDFEYETQMALTNRTVAGVRTVFLPANPARSFVTSTFIREIARYGGDVSALVPPSVLALLKERYAR